MQNVLYIQYSRVLGSLRCLMYLCPPPSPYRFPRQPRYLLTHTRSKTSAVMIEAHIVVVSLPVHICLRPLLISASGVLMSARIQMIYLFSPENLLQTHLRWCEIFIHTDKCTHVHRYECTQLNAYTAHTSQDNYIYT